MEALSHLDPQLQGALRPDWKKGEVWTSAGSLLVLWEVNIEHAYIKVFVLEPQIQAVEARMDSGIKRLIFGMTEDAEDQDAKGKGGKDGKDGKGGGGNGSKKGGKSSKLKATIPVSATAFRHEPSVVRDRLGSLHMAKYPFEIKIRAIKEQQLIERGHAHLHVIQAEETPVREPGRLRGAASLDMVLPSAAQTHHAGISSMPANGPDPWMQAAQQQAVPAAQALPPQAVAAAVPSMPSAASTAQPSGMSSDQLQQGPVMFGQRIHA